VAPAWTRRTLLRVLVGALVFLVVGNLAIVGASRWMAMAQPAYAVPVSVDGVKHLVAVDGRLWRGAAPSHDGYASLAANGVTRVIDLRAEDDVDVDTAWLASIGIEYLRLPVRDGQIPSRVEVERFLDAVRTSDGTVFVHCGAGVGRTPRARRRRARHCGGTSRSARPRWSSSRGSPVSATATPTTSDASTPPSSPSAGRSTHPGASGPATGSDRRAPRSRRR
jgi:protein tyrosine phosphatase (PTP) superfamily phosphohydrolase (DUF442 family)